MSVWLLVVIFMRLANRQTPPRRFWVHDVLRRQDDLGEYARLLQELRLDSNSFHRYFWMSTEQFDYVLGLVGPHISRLASVYVDYLHGHMASYDDVIRTKVCRNRACPDFCTSRRTTSYDVAHSVNAANTLHVFDYNDYVRCHTWLYIIQRCTQCKRR